ncbi:hypothetical protein VTO42DRAFT_7188 [Malbranchea cinnamomea]
MASTVQQWATNLTGIDSLKRTEAPMPVPGPGQVLVEIRAMSLNYRDVEVVQGEYTHHKSVSGSSGETVLVPCSDMCGTIVQLGPDLASSSAPPASNWKIGDRVLSTFLPRHQTGQVTEKEMASGLGLPQQGVLATHRIFNVDELVRAPGYLSDEEASTLPIASVTAWMSVTGRKTMNLDGGKEEADREKFVLVQGTGGVAIAGLQIAKAMGMKVVVTSSSDDKLAQATALGADHTINYRTTPHWEKEVMRLTDGRGVDIILETGGAHTLRKSFDCIAFGGLINSIGYTSGKMDPADTEEGGGRLNLNVLALRRNVTIKGIINGPKDQFEEMVRFYEQKGIKPVVNRVFGFQESKEAFAFLRAGGHFGKVVIKVN